MQRICKAVIQKMSRRGVTKALAAWCDYSVRMRTCKAVILKMSRRGVAKALAAWGEYTTGKAVARQTMRKAAARIAKLGCAAAMAAWQAMASKQRATRNMLSKCIKRIQGGVIFRAMLQWQEYVDHVRSVALEQDNTQRISNAVASAADEQKRALAAQEQVTMIARELEEVAARTAQQVEAAQEEGRQLKKRADAAIIAKEMVRCAPPLLCKPAPNIARLTQVRAELVADYTHVSLDNRLWRTLRRLIAIGKDCAVPCNSTLPPPRSQILIRGLRTGLMPRLLLVEL